MTTFLKNKLCLFIYFFIILFPVNKLYSEEINKTLDSPAIESSKTSITESPDNKKKHKSKNTNIDAKMMYGPYDNIFASFNFTHSLEDFTYQLNSGLERLNDFGYQNSNYYKAEIGFTGEMDIIKSWKVIPQFEVKNGTRGMFDNSTYTYEKADMVSAALKSVYEPAQSRWDFNLDGIYYVHRLMLAQPVNNDEDRCNFYRIGEEIGWENIWSASNRIRVKHSFTQYFYSLENAENDSYVNNEIIGSFKITGYIMVEIGPMLNWNRDAGWFPSGKVTISSSGLEYFALEFSYVYDLIAFKPEDFYYRQKYIMPTCDLPPGKEHHAGFKSKLEYNFSNKGNFYIRQIRIMVEGYFKKNNNFYNYYALPENVFYAETIRAETWNAKGDALFEIRVFKNSLKFGINYEYNHYTAAGNITYRPEHVIGGLVEYIIDRCELKWINRLMGEVYISPEDNRKMSSVVLGTLEMQLKIVESFFFYASFDNLYNEKYNYRYGYPEPGFTFLGGLRIII